jgi:hypothetical protein
MTEKMCAGTQSPHLGEAGAELQHPREGQLLAELGQMQRGGS